MFCKGRIWDFVLVCGICHVVIGLSSLLGSPLHGFVCLRFVCLRLFVVTLYVFCKGRIGTLFLCVVCVMLSSVVKFRFDYWF